MLLVAAALGMYHLVEGGCSGKCCQGTDLTCVTTDWRMDRVYGTCYCDEGCIRTKDCCFDYSTECPGKRRHYAIKSDIETEPKERNRKPEYTTSARAITLKINAVTF